MTDCPMTYAGESMEDKLYLKTGKDGLWEKNATAGAAVYMIVGTIIFLSSISVVVPIDMFLKKTLGLGELFFDVITVIWALAGIFGIVAVCILANQSHNISKSTAFILRKGQLYVVQLFYTNRKLGTETTSDRDEIQVANDVQAHEKEVRARRNNPASFIEALNDILLFLANNPDFYYAKPDSEMTDLDRFVKTKLQNAGPVRIDTENAQYGFLKLNNPVVIEENNKYFVLKFDNEYGDLCTAKFTNCFGNLPDDIKNGFPES